MIARIGAFVFGACLLAWPMAASQEAPGSEGRQVTESEQGAATDAVPKIPEPQGIETAETEEEEFHKHHIGLFLGGSTEKSNNGFTLGGEYEYRFHRFLGAGVMAEHAWNLRNAVVAFPAFFHPGGGLILAAGPGFEHPDGGDSDSSSHDGAEGHEGTKFLFRVGVMYVFKVSEKLSLVPNLSLDFVDGNQTFVYGVTLGFGF